MTKKWKDQWGSALELDEGLFRLRLRSPGKSLIVNTYVYSGGGALAVIDAGWPETVDQLETALADMGLAKSLRDVDYWLYTHAHIDHMGAAALISQKTHAPQIAWQGLEPYRERWHAFQDDMHNWTPWIAEAFAEPHRSRLLAERKNQGGLVDKYGRGVLENAAFVEFGERLEIGDLTLEFHDARGHDPHHGAFFAPERGWLFCGDVVIAVPTPICRAMNDELDTYRDSLDRLQALDAQFLLPGHGLHRRDNIDASFERSRSFVTDYEGRTLALLRELGRPMGLYELALAFTPDGKPYQPASRWWVHIAQVDSHLHALIERGDVMCFSGEHGPLYEAS
ncbi:MBL fold metallo-hydrolase [Persicimonas caeni]|uniref:MBL fold metallo-hydrolase n=1 Tax=Persicimonas caeni TaxID=2292766 RepID=A0A4Y6PU45_PERCE|nr:MBL fold metallo-hydrolase [Persicimonas caeni]QDG51842.1 MBL fold metallo-hydrolase [Persicimonas caeni]QED33063.1 MBL fold metallo-hydrolase [Persicimonas caeni]